MKEKILKNLSAVILSAVAAGIVTLPVQPEYYECCKISVSAAEQTIITGDVNGDGIFSAADITYLQKWMLGYIDELAVWKAGDLSGDGRIDIIDLCFMKSALIEDDIQPEQPEKPIDAPIKKVNASTPSVGNVKMLSIYVDFNDVTYNQSLYSDEQIKNELFGNGSEAQPYESLTGFFERSSYGNMHLSGDVYRYTCSGKISDYQNDNGFENMAMEVLNGLNDRIDYSDYDSDSDGVIDCVSFSIPVESADQYSQEFWYGCTATWYQNTGFSVDGKRLNKYIIMDVSPYKDQIVEMKKAFIHEMGHSMGLADYYKYGSYDWEGMTGSAGYTKMDDMIGDFCSFDKIMLGWLTDSQIQKYSGSGIQTFELDDSSVSGSCLILPINSSADDYNSEYFLIEYITNKENNADLLSWDDDSGVRILHVQGEIVTDYWGDTSFKYNNYSPYYQGDDKTRIIRLVNDGNGFYHSGSVISFGTPGFAAYDTNGYQTIDTGYTVSIGDIVGGKYSVTVEKR